MFLFVSNNVIELVAVAEFFSPDYAKANQRLLIVL